MLKKSRLKAYPDGFRVLTVYKTPALIGLQGSGSNSAALGSSLSNSEIERLRVARLYQIKHLIKDLVLANEFTLFVTFTFDPAKIDRSDDLACYHALSNFLERLRKRSGAFKYVILPERHKSGEIHFHGVLGGYKGALVDSGHVDKHSAIVFNVVDWNYGFSTATKIRSRLKASSYITKYVTKDLANSPVQKGKKKYWRSRGLAMPVIKYSSDDIAPADVQPVYENDVCLVYSYNE